MTSNIEFRNYADDLSFIRPTPRAVVRDERLSFAARGLFIFLADLPTTWSINFSDISRRGGPRGRTAVRTTIDELRAIGALEITQVKGQNGRFGRTVWTLQNPQGWASETPLSRTKCEAPPQSGFLSPENPTAEEPLTGNAPLRVNKIKVSREEGAPTTTTTAASSEIDATPTIELSVALASHVKDLLIAAGGRHEWLRLLDCELRSRSERARRGEGAAIIRPRAWGLATLHQWSVAGQPDLSAEGARLAQMKSGGATIAPPL